MNFNKEELVDMIFVLGESERNCLLANRIYHQRYPERRLPKVDSFQKLLDRFVETGNVQYEKRERIKNVVNEENELSVVLATTEDPHISQRKVCSLVGISRRSVGRILKKNKFHAYHIQMHQELSDDDFLKRLQFCNWARGKMQEDATFFNNVLFTDEATFHKNGFVNRHNFHYYATENPHFFRQRDNQHRWSINVWGGIIGEHVIGPHFFDGTLTGAIYLHFLENYLPQLLVNLPQRIRNRMWLQQDGAPPHYLNAVRDHLNNIYPHQWIGRNGPTKWPARSPDLTKMDFFLWGYVKEIVYTDTPTTIQNMKDRIIHAFRSITPAILRKVETSFQRRIEMCVNQNGQHVEHLI